MKEIGGIARPLTPTLSRLRERELLLPQAGEGWDEGVCDTSVHKMNLKKLKFLSCFGV